jgi:ABC-type polysaccharide/polyol phosphate export permease
LQVIDKEGIMFHRVARKIPGTFFLRNLVDRRSLLFQLVRRDFEQRFVGSAMGWIWGLIQPLVLLASWVFIFSFCLKQSVPPGEATDKYPLFLFAGMLPWMLFNETLTRSASSLLEQANLITKTVFPAEMIPVAVFLSSLASHLLALTLMIGVMAVYANQISIFLILLPVYIFVLGLLAVGLGWIVASLQVFLRDTAQILTVVLTFWFWLTPIFLAASQFPPRAQPLLGANPLYYLVRAYRILLLSSRVPDWRDLAIATLFGAVVFIAGGLFFRHMKRGFADVL